MKPFLRWVGGKRRMLPLLRQAVAELGVDLAQATYHEPFLGGGALCLDVLHQVRAVHAGDVNRSLIRTWRAVRDDVDGVIDRYAAWSLELSCGTSAWRRWKWRNARFFKPEQQPDVEVAAWFLALNRFGFNGLWRVNSHNFPNMPVGDRPLPLNEDNLRAVSTALQAADIQLHARGFEHSLADVAAGDLVYLDSPYPGQFDGYTPDGFNTVHHTLVLMLARRCRRRGAHVLVSGPDIPAMRQLYDGWTPHVAELTHQVGLRRPQRGELVLAGSPQ